MTALAARLGSLLPGLRSLDRVLLALAAILAALALADPLQARTSLGFVLGSLAGAAPFLLASVAIAAAAGASGADNIIARAFAGREAAMVVAAALVGALSPFCSCGVIPLVAALLAMGVPLAPVMAFWLASPVMDPAQFVMTAGILGTDFAVAKLAAAIGLGLIGGWGTLAVARAGALGDPLRPGLGNGGCGGARIRAPKPVRWAFWQEAERRQRFRREAVRTLLFLGKWMALAFLLESLMLAWVPAGAVAGLVGGEGLLPVLTATLVGIPAYLNGFAALPLVSGLLAQGMAPGAALAFLVAGAVSCIPAAVAVWAVARPRVFALYLGFAVLGSLASGLIFGAVA